MSSSRTRCQAARAPSSAHAHKPPQTEGLEMEMERMEPQGEVGLGVPEEEQPSPSRQAWSRDNPGFEPEEGLEASWSPGRRSLSDTSSSSGSSGLGSFTGGSNARIHRGLYPTPPADGLQHEPPSWGARILEKIRRNACMPSSGLLFIIIIIISFTSVLTSFSVLYMVYHYYYYSINKCIYPQIWKFQSC